MPGPRPVKVPTVYKLDFSSSGRNRSSFVSFDFSFVPIEMGLIPWVLLRRTLRIQDGARRAIASVLLGCVG